MPEQRQGSNDLVKVAYAQDQAEAAMIQGLLENEGISSILGDLGINGPQLGFGLLVKNPQRVLVRADHADQARALLAEALVEDQGGAWQETANANHLEDAAGKKPRNYGVIGAYVRIYLWAFGIFALAFGVFLLLRAS